MTDAICLCGKVLFLKGRHATLFIHLTSIHTNVTPESQDHVEKFFILLRSRVFTKLQICITLRASFTKQGKLARKCNSKTAQMGVEMSASDLLTMRKLKNTDTTSHLHIDQRNIKRSSN